MWASTLLTGNWVIGACNELEVVHGRVERHPCESHRTEYKGSGDPSRREVRGVFHFPSVLDGPEEALPLEAS